MCVSKPESLRKMSDEVHHKLLKKELNEYQVSKIVEEYDIGRYVSHEIINGGLANTNVRLITTKGMYLFKICEDKNLEELEVDFKISIYLHLLPFTLSPTIKGSN